MSEENMFLDSFGRLLSEIASPAAVRSVHHGDGADTLWQTLLESGFVDALVPESQGGAGLSRSEVAPLLQLAGKHVLPVAFGHTVVARFLAATAGVVLPVDGPIVLWPANDAGQLQSHVVPAAFEAGHALVQTGTSFAVMPLTSGDALDGFGFRPSRLDASAKPLLQFEMPGCDLLAWAAALTSLVSAGAISRVLELSQQHVSERQQFGRPLGGFQAIQHMIAQAAEQSVLAGTAARIGFASEGDGISPLRAALAKTVTDGAAAELSRIAHAVHGAIGISEEHDLQLFTRQLKRWQLSYGTQQFWADRIGAARLAAPEGTAVDFIRANLVP